MPSQKKVDLVQDLKDRFLRSTIVIGTGFIGLDVNTISKLRRSLRDNGIEYRVVKNNLASIAAHDSGHPQIAEVLNGPTGLLLGYDDPVQSAKALEEYIRTTRVPLTVIGAVLDGRVLSSQDVTALAALPPKPELIANIAGQLINVVQQLGRALVGPSQHLLYTANKPSQSLATLLSRYSETA